MSVSKGDGPPGRSMARQHVLLVDTSTHQAVVSVGRALDGLRSVLATSRRDTGHRHGSQLLAQLDEVLATAALGLADMDAIAVGTGPGSFTGLRVGLATAKTLAYVRRMPLLGLSSVQALARAAARACDVGPHGGVTVVLPAGAHDHYVARPSGPPELVPPGGLDATLAGDATVMTIDMAPDRLGERAHRLGQEALGALPEAMLEMALERLATGAVDDPASLVPGYVSLPRGIGPGLAGEPWSPDLR